MVASELVDSMSKELTNNESIIPQIKSAIEYAERYQHKPSGYYNTNCIPPKTQQAINLLVKFLTGTISEDSVWNDIHSMLRFTMR